MTETAELYDQDFLLWTQEQAKLLREAAERRVNFPHDWNNLAEEIESLGKSQRSELRNRIGTIIEHLIKLAHSRAQEPRERWRETVRRSRREAELVLADNPSLRNEVPSLVKLMFEKFADFPVDDLIQRGELDPTARARILALPYSAEQVLGDWLPDEPVRQ
jgi:hypothetical protein